MKFRAATSAYFNASRASLAIRDAESAVLANRRTGVISGWANARPVHVSRMACCAWSSSATGGVEAPSCVNAAPAWRRISAAPEVLSEAICFSVSSGMLRERMSLPFTLGPEYSLVASRINVGYNRGSRNEAKMVLQFAPSRICSPLALKHP